MIKKLSGNSVIDKFFATGYSLFHPLRTKTGFAFSSLYCLLFCPRAWAQITPSPFARIVIAENSYFASSLIIAVSLAVALVMALLSFYLIRTKAKLDHSLDHARQITRQLKLSGEQLSHMVATSPTILFSLKVEKGRLIPLWISENLTRITGYSIDEALNPRWWQRHLHKDDRARVLSESRELFLGKHLTYEYRFIHRNGSILWIRDEQQLICDHNGLPQEVMAAWTDITERKIEEIDLRITATAFDTKEGIIITDKEGLIIRVNKAFTRLTGYSMEEAIGHSPKMLHSGRHTREFYQQLWGDLKRDRHWEGEVWDRHKNGTIYPVWLSITAVTDNTGAVSHYVSTFFDISERKEAEEYIRNLAFYDPLTHLPNRRLMLDRLGIALVTSHRNHHHGALMFMDLDRFKILNDTQGHDTGDRLLIEVAKRLQSCVREGDTVARMGGDEFVVMLENLSKNQEEAAVQTQAVAEKIRDALAATYWLQGRNMENASLLEHHSSVSIGLVLFNGYTVTSEDLLKRADLAMYQAKQAGRDTIRVFDPAMQSALDERTALEADLRQALGRNEFVLYFQAQVNASGQTVGAEVLLHWHQSRRGSVPSAKFIALAEETGLILPIGQWVLTQGCATLAAWASHPATRHLTLALNISPRQFRQPDFIEQLRIALKDSGADPKRLKLEITESLVMENLDLTIGKMSAIKHTGVGFAMDDFGTGYSSLSNLPRLPLEQLKIDKGFIRDLSEDNQDAAIIRSVLSLGRSLELTVIAEGVETEEQWQYLVKNGCPLFQGYFFGKPMPLAEFEARLLKDGCDAQGERL
jgi:diguanylate cyclase (GGDEF)-like protein/PAS domain S-box-containing protein